MRIRTRGIFYSFEIRLFVIYFFIIYIYKKCRLCAGDRIRNPRLSALTRNACFKKRPGIYLRPTAVRRGEIHAQFDVPTVLLIFARVMRNAMTKLFS